LIDAGVFTDWRDEPDANDRYARDEGVGVVFRFLDPDTVDLCDTDMGRSNGEYDKGGVGEYMYGVCG
jgi:hypothetical protein